MANGEWQPATCNPPLSTLNHYTHFIQLQNLLPLLCFEGKLVGLQIEMERLQAFRAIFFCKRQLTENGRFFSAS